MQTGPKLRQGEAQTLRGRISREGEVLDQAPVVC
jgi:hypothetical protein